MPALSVIDLAMFLLETGERPYNIGPLAIIAPPANFRGNFADKLLERLDWWRAYAAAGGGSTSRMRPSQPSCVR